MTAGDEEMRHYAVSKTPQRSYRTWMAATGRFVFAKSFETLLCGLRFAEWRMSLPGQGVRVCVEFRSVITEFSAGPPYPLLGGPAGDELAVHDVVLGIDAVARTMLELERQVRCQVHLGRVVCPPEYGRIELVYRDGFTIATGSPKVVTLHTGWKPAPRDVSESDASGKAEIKRVVISLLTKKKMSRKIFVNTGRSAHV